MKISSKKSVRKCEKLKNVSSKILDHECKFENVSS